MLNDGVFRQVFGGMFEPFRYDFESPTAVFFDAALEIPASWVEILAELDPDSLMTDQRYEEIMLSPSAVTAWHRSHGRWRPL